MDLKEKLDNLSEKFRQRGVVDIKFCANYAAPFNQLANDVIDVMEAVLSGRYNPAPPLGDSCREDNGV